MHAKSSCFDSAWYRTVSTIWNCVRGCILTVSWNAITRGSDIRIGTKVLLTKESCCGFSFICDPIIFCK